MIFNTSKNLLVEIQKKPKQKKKKQRKTKTKQKQMLHIFFNISWRKISTHESEDDK